MLVLCGNLRTLAENIHVLAERWKLLRAGGFRYDEHVVTQHPRHLFHAGGGMSELLPEAMLTHLRLTTVCRVNGVPPTSGKTAAQTEVYKNRHITAHLLQRCQKQLKPRE